MISDAAWLFDSAEKDIQEIEGKARKKVETDFFKAALLTPQRIMGLSFVDPSKVTFQDWIGF